MLKDEVKIIPKEVLFGNPEKTNAQISPDGNYIAYIAPDNRNVKQIFVKNLITGEEKMISEDQKRGISFYQWTFNNGKLLSLQDKDGDENFHVYLVDFLNNTTKDLTPFPETRVWQPVISSNKPDEIIVFMNYRDNRCFDHYRINLITDKSDMIYKNEENSLGWYFDQNLELRAFEVIDDDGNNELFFRKKNESEFKKLLKFDNSETFYIVHFDENSEKFYVKSNMESDTSKLVLFDPDTMEKEVIIEDNENDFESIAFNAEHKMFAVSVYKDERIWHVLDAGFKEDFEIIQNIRNGELNFINTDLSGNKMLISFSTEGSVFYYLYDRITKESTFIFEDRPELSKYDLTKIEPFDFISRDGFKVHGYLSLPLYGEKPFPAVLLVHGGPWSRDKMGFFPKIQMLTNRGYAAITINFRGSTGYGKKFMKAGYKEWGGKMHDDLIDGVEYLADKNIIDRNKISIAGASYGGYAVLAGLAFTPEFFCCGIDIVGPSNLITMINSFPPYLQILRKSESIMVGDVDTEKEFLESRSPLFSCHKITKPLLIGQGKNDPRVPVQESDQIYDAMKENGKDVKYVLYEDEGHGFMRPENNLHFYTIVEEFLAEHLGGRYEPFYEIKGHSGIIK